MLTLHQQDIVDSSLSILKNFSKLLIKGNAGVGKTFIIDYILKPFFQRKKTILITAPTHKAVSVIKSKINIDSKDKDDYFSTLHSALKLRRKVNNRTGEVTFTPNFDKRYPPLAGVDYLVIDEASMVSKSLLNYIDKYAKDCKIIFLGDDKQINPVNEKESPVFHQGYPEVELIEIIRQGNGNPIIDLSRDLDKINSLEENLVEDTERGQAYVGYTYTVDTNRIIKALAEANGTDEIKYLAWTNREVNSMNKAVREEVYGNPNKIEVGEALIFNAPYGEEFHTNQEIRVDTLDVGTFTVPYIAEHNKRTGALATKEAVLKLYRINPNPNFKVDSNLPPGVLVIHEDSEKDFKDLMTFLESQCRGYRLPWTEFYNFKEKFADMKYNHAITIHKSQGSTYNKAIINIEDVNKNRESFEKERLLYTAVTRASNFLILYKA